MTEWRVLEAGRRTDYCPVALELRDEFTGGPMIGEARIALEVKHGLDWMPSDRQPTRTPAGLHVYMGLGRAADPAALPSYRVRVRVTAAYYRPRYRTTADGVEFDVGSYNDGVAPVPMPLMPEIVLMLPTSSYPFAGHVRVLRGRVLDPFGDPVADALIGPMGWSG